MLKKTFIFLLFNLFFVIGVLMLTKGTFMFHVTGSKTLTETLIKTPHKLTYDQNYIINHPMRYLINIESEDGLKTGTLIWPTEPFGRFLIIVPYQSKELNEQEYFEGKLTRCVYKCYVSGMYIEMFDFVKTLETRFPQYKGKFSKLPSIVINTTDKPLGLNGYLKITEYYWMAFTLFFILGLIVWIKSVFFRSR